MVDVLIDFKLPTAMLHAGAQGTISSHGLES
jgi:hypothetical protein